jgi:hypothetical protein
VTCALLLRQSASSAPNLAQQVLSGVVRDAVTGETLSQVLVVATGSGKSSSSSTNGVYTIALSPGLQTVRWSRVGYKSETRNIRSTEADSTHLDILLVQSTILMGEEVVTAERPPLSTIHGLGALSISPSRTADIGGPFSDVYRTLQTITGVTSNNEMSSRFYVRGGASNENLLQLNGAQVLDPFHLKESPNTSLGVINVDLLKQVLFIPGGFSARYGDKLSSVLDLEYREGTKDRFAGVAELSLVTLGLTAETPIGCNASGLISAHTSYSNYLEHYFADGLDRHPSFFDVQGMLAGDPSPDVHASGFFLFSRDRTSGVANGKYGSTLVSLHSDFSLSDRTILRAALSSYTDLQNLSWNIPRELEGTSILATDFSTTLEEVSLRLESELNDSYSFLAGAEFRESLYNLVDRKSVV